MTEKDQIYLLALSNIKGLSNRVLISLLQEYKTPYNLYLNFPLVRIKSAKKKAIIKYQLKADEIIKRAKEIINQSNKNNISIISSENDKYPILLKECEDRPPFLFVKGNYNPNANKLIAVVGTRSSTSYGETFCEELSHKLRNFNVGVVSGLAYGIDFHIHKKSLDSNIPNIGVLGSGINNIYPYEHQKLSERIMENGLLISENPPNTPPIAYNFPKRNRIIAGMAQATIIIESPLKGGAIITAKLANDYNRDVYAVPGSVLQHNSKGCNQLIKNHQACLIDDPSELIEQLELKDKNEKFEDSVINNLREFNNETEKLIYELIQKEKEISMDKLQQLTQINFPELSEVLFSLELNDSIKQYPGKIYTL